jgi:predicted DNA-binding antitoxin AbrB/MazE fold protein
MTTIIRDKGEAMTTVRARFDGKVFVPAQPVDLPPGCELEIRFASPETESRGKTTLARLAEILEQFPANPDWPPDSAEQHGHYLYGTPKKP